MKFSQTLAHTVPDEVLDLRPDFIEHQLAHRALDPNDRAQGRTKFLSEWKHMIQVWEH